MALQVPVRLALKNVLFATDFSPVSEAALPFAVAIARRFESSIHAVHVLSSGMGCSTPGESTCTA